MKKSPIALLLAASWCLAAPALLGQIIVVNDSDGDGVSDGPRELLPDTAGQKVRLYVTGGAAVQGLNFNVQVADGFPDGGGTTDGPNITDVDILGTALEPTIFFGNNTGQTTVRNDAQVWSAFTTTSSGTVNASGLLAIVEITTVGWFTGTWTFALEDTLEGATDFPLIATTITDGSITVVPEPSAGLIVAAGLLGCAVVIRRRKAPVAPAGERELV
jgi:hypothetical protein